MKTVVLLFAVLFLGFVASKAWSDTFPDGPSGPRIAVVNTSELSDSVLKADLPYLQQYADQVCAAWHCAGTLYFGQPQSPRDWVLTFNEVSDIQDAIGYHTEDFGLPVGFVSVRTAQQYGLSWSLVATHELAEMLVDPEAEGADLTHCKKGASNCAFYAREVADPVQGESYQLGPLRVADFVYRNWFVPDASGPFDAGRHLRSPLSLAPQSYMSFYKDGVWQQASTLARSRNWDRFGN